MPYPPNDFGLMQNINKTPLLMTLYSLSVVSAGTIYLNSLVLICLLPLQAVFMGNQEGPEWMYATGGLMVVFEYYLWALEIASFWFKPEELKLHYLSD